MTAIQRHAINISFLLHTVDIGQHQPSINSMDRARQLRLARISNIFLSSPWLVSEANDMHIFMQAQMAESQWARQQLFQHRCKTLHNRLARKCLSAWWDVLLDKHVSCPTFTAGRCKSRNGIVQDYLHLL